MARSNPGWSQPLTVGQVLVHRETGVAAYVARVPSQGVPALLATAEHGWWPELDLRWQVRFGDWLPQ